MPQSFEQIKSKPLSSYLDKEITERLQLTQPIDTVQSGNRVNQIGQAMGDNRSVLSLSEEQSSFSSKSLSIKKKAIPDEEEERGSNSESIKDP